MKEEHNTIDFVDSFQGSDVVIENKETVYQGFFKIDKYQVRHPLFNGGVSDIVQRELMDRGNAAAIVPYDPLNDTVVLIEQFRIGALAAKAEHVWQVEIVAGVIDPGEKPEGVAYRECQEEAGITPKNIQKIMTYFPSSGGCSERIALFIGQVDSTQAKGIHGLAVENEDIRVQVVKRETAFKWIEQGIIENAASVIGLQWLQMNYKNLQHTWNTQKTDKTKVKSE